MSDVEITEAIHAALVADASESAIFASELAFSGGDRRCDFWKISAHRSKGFEATAFEIKVSRGDFKRDTRIKQREARLFSDRFYYVAPIGLIGKDELPDWAGLIEWDGSRLKRTVAAPLRDKDSPTWELVVSLIRNSGKINRDTDAIKKRALNAERQLKDATKALREKGLEPWRFGITT